VVRGQYFAGAVNGEARPGYRQEPKVKTNSNVETYVALKLFIDNWRWAGVPVLFTHREEPAHERERSADSVSTQRRMCYSQLNADRSWMRMR